MVGAILAYDPSPGFLAQRGSLEAGRRHILDAIALLC
jgi:hypothetical protein